MFKSKKLKRALSFITASVICMFAFTQVLYAAEPIAYALNGTIGSLGTLIDEVPWDSIQDNGTIKIKLRDPAAGAQFSSYKLLEVKYEGGMLKVSVPANAQAFWQYYCDKASDVTVNDIKTKLAAVPGEEAAKSSSIVNKFFEFSGSKPAPSAPTDVTGNVATINTEFGFYIIQQTQAPDNGYIASAPVLACLPMQRTAGGTWLSSYTAQPKDAQLTISKKVQAPDDPEHIKETIAEIGNTLKYKIVVDIAKYGSDITSPTYTIVDKLPAGIEYDDGTPAVVKFYKGSNPASPAGTYTVAYDGGTRTLTLDLTSNYANLAECDTVEITYQATLDSDAVIEDVGNENEVTLTYTTDSAGTEGHVSATAKVYTHELEITKVDAAAPHPPLAGAVFEVYRSAEDANTSTNPINFVALSGTGYETGKHYRVATADDINKITSISVSDSDDISKGKMKIYGLDDDTYYFKETVAPTGYNLPDGSFAISPAPDADEKTVDNGVTIYQNMTAKRAEITNDSGINLPVTGGIGTIIFTVAGLLLMVGAAYVLFFSKKKSN